jgi:hypothetical protein
MPGLEPGIHVVKSQGMDGRDKPGHDNVRGRGSDPRPVMPALSRHPISFAGPDKNGTPDHVRGDDFCKYVSSARRALPARRL